MFEIGLAFGDIADTPTMTRPLPGLLFDRPINGAPPVARHGVESEQSADFQINADLGFYASYRAARGDQKDCRWQKDRAGTGFGRRLDLASDRLAVRLSGLLLLDQPGRWSHHQRLPRFFLGAAADDRRVGPLDGDLGEPGSRQNSADIVGVGKGEGAGFVSGLWRRRPQMAKGDVVGDQSVPVLCERPPVLDTLAAISGRRTGDRKPREHPTANKW
jgi:hypothetical protein